MTTKLPIQIFQPKADKHNFGDLLGFRIAKEILATRGIEAVLWSGLTDKKKKCAKRVLIPIGTMIASSEVRALPETITIDFWGCGSGRDASFHKDKFPNVRIHGARGPITAGQLREEDPILGDAGFLAPRFWPAVGGMNESVIYAKHLTIGDIPESFLDRIHAEGVWSTEISATGFETALQAILAPAFVLTSSLHVAIIRAAYGRPWAFAWPDGVLPQFPGKYLDLCALLNVEFRPVRTYRDALLWWEAFGKGARMSEAALDALVSIFPFPESN